MENKAASISWAEAIERMIAMKGVYGTQFPVCLSEMCILTSSTTIKGDFPWHESGLVLLAVRNIHSKKRA
jgi:hypothetical protein